MQSAGKVIWAVPPPPLYMMPLLISLGRGGSLVGFYTILQCKYQYLRMKLSVAMLATQ